MCERREYVLYLGPARMQCSYARGKNNKMNPPESKRSWHGMHVSKLSLTTEPGGWKRTCPTCMASCWIEATAVVR
jgi:hypothetical protein